MQFSDRIGRRMKLHDIHVLMAVVQAGSMGKAAALLNTTQSAISRSIADLEHAVGVRLLDRNPHGIEPTQYGRALLKRGVAVFDELKQSVQDIEFLSDPGAGELRVEASAGLTEGIVTTVIDRMSRQYPRAVFHVVLAGTLALYNDLRERRAEVGVERTFGTVPEDMDREVLFEDPLVVVAGMKNPWSRRGKVKLAELVNEPWTWAAETVFDTMVVEAFRASGAKPPRAAVYCDAVNMRLRLAATGRFLTVVPSFMLKLPTKRVSLKVLPIELPTMYRQIGIIRLKNRTLSPLAQLFIEHTREVAKTLTKRK
jgi:DNA-binding transcriptional LysR family regulator